MFSIRHHARFPLSASLVLLALPVMLPSLQAAPVTVTPTVTGGSGLFHYNYSIINTSATDLSDVAVTVASGPGTLQNLMAPMGFSAFFDSGLGVVDFVESARLFTAGTTVGGFTFDSPLRPAASSFAAVGLDANQNAVNFTGPTLAPTGAPAAVPEPGTLVFLATGLLLLLAISTARFAKRAQPTVTSVIEQTVPEYAANPY